MYKHHQQDYGKVLLYGSKFALFLGVVMCGVVSQSKPLDFINFSWILFIINTIKDQ